MPNQTINVALLSFGMSGKLFHAPFIHAHPGFKLNTVWERSRQIAREIYPGIHSAGTLEEILNDEAIDLVVVNTPNYTHYDYTSRALRAGKHVLVEKPFTVNAIEAENLIRLAKECNRKLAVYHNRRWDSDFLTVKKILLSGMLGEIVEAEIHFDRFNQNLSPKQHKETGGPGTGALHDLGSHLIDSATQLFGIPEYVFADLRIIRNNSLVNDYVDVLLYYDDKRVRLKSSYIVKEALPGFIIHGRNGSFFKSRSDNQESDLLAGKVPGTDDWGIENETQQGWYNILQEGKTKRAHVVSEKGNYMDFYDQLHQSIIQNAPVPVRAEEALLVMKIIDAAIESNASQKIANLDA